MHKFNDLHLFKSSITLLKRSSFILNRDFDLIQWQISVNSDCLITTIGFSFSFYYHLHKRSCHNTPLPAKQFIVELIY